MKRNKHALLKQVSLLRGLSNKTLNRIASYAHYQHFRRGEQIFSESSPGGCLYVLVNGRVKIYTQSLGRAKTFALLDPGDFFGEMALLGETTRSASARAILDSELLVLERRDFHQFIKSEPNLSLTILQTLCDRLRKADHQIEMLSFQNVVGRTAITLLELEGKYGKSVSGGSLIDADISQQELADLVGTAREMVSRVIARFKKMNALSLEKNSSKIIILSREKLKNCIYQ